MNIRWFVIATLLVVLGPLAVAAEAPDPRVQYEAKLAQVKGTADEHLALALWCQRSELLAEMAKHLEAVIGLVPEQPKARRLLGYEKIKGAWLRGADLAKAKGHLLYHGRWLPASEIARIESRKKRFAQLSAQRADWANAWELKTEHFKLRSNCPAPIVQEIAVAIERCHGQLAAIFQPRKAQPIPLEIYATQEQFMRESMRAGIPVSLGTLGYFYYGSESGIRCFYAGSLERTLGVLFHECTHLIIRSAYNEPPIWSNEGMAVFFEFARVSDTGLDIRSIPYDRLWHLRDQLKKGEVNLRTLVSLRGSSEFSVEYYAQGWGLIHYLLYANNGKFMPALQKYYQQKVRRDPIGDFKAAFGASPEELAKPWEEYIAKLEPTSVEELLAAGLAAIDDRGNAELALGYAKQARDKAPKDWRTIALEGRILLRLALLDRDQAQAEKAVEAFDAALAIRPPAKGGKKASLRDLQIDYERGLASVTAGDSARAISCAEDILERDDFNAPAYRLLALAMVTASDPASRDIAEARENLKTANDLGASHENKWVAARIAEAEGDDQAAIDLLHKAASEDLFGFGAQFYQREAMRLMMKAVKTHTP